MSGRLSHSPSDVVRKLLIDVGVGVQGSFDANNKYTGSAWPVFSAGEPDLPDSAITVYGTAGRTQGRTHTDGETQEFNGIQVRIRAAAHGAGYAKASQIADALDRTVNKNTVTIGVNRYLVHAITRTGEVLVLGTETPTSKRKLFTINAVVSMEQKA